MRGGRLDVPGRIGTFLPVPSCVNASARQSRAPCCAREVSIHTPYSTGDLSRLATFLRLLTGSLSLSGTLTEAANV